MTLNENFTLNVCFGIILLNVCLYDCFESNLNFIIKYFQVKRNVFLSNLVPIKSFKSMFKMHHSPPFSITSYKISETEGGNPPPGPSPTR